MIADARTAGLPDSLHADLVIIGAGAAGITLALSLANSMLDIVLVEAGGPKYSAAAQSFYAGEAVDPAGHSPVDMYRRRVFGGSTTLWGGRCIPFDDIDFEDRPWMDFARWPIGPDDVAAHIHRAMQLLEAGCPEFEAGEALAGPPAMVDGVANEDILLDRIERFSKPTNFGARYRAELERAPNIRLFTNAPTTRILLGSGGRVAGAVIDAGGRAVTLVAPRVVIAAGGIETPRLLLAGNPSRPHGIGNEHDLVGRFYQCHLEGSVGTLHFLADANDVRLDYELSHDGVYCRRYIALSPHARRRHRLAGLVVRPTHPGIVDPDHRSAVLSAMYLAKAFIMPEYARKMTALEHQARAQRGGSALAYHAAHIRNIILGSPGLTAFAKDWTRRRILASRKLPSVVLNDPRGFYPADINAEQEPNPESRITLGTDRDSLGMPKVRVAWRATGEDYHRLFVGLRRVESAFMKSRVARFDLSGVTESSLIDMIVPIGGHHIGTARMAGDPREGVCDANGEVFSVPGLFIAGAAVFPTSSFANPTLTLVALTLRLAEHLTHGRPRLDSPSTRVRTGAVHA